MTDGGRDDQPDAMAAHAIRIRPRAETDIRDAFLWFTHRADLATAQAWRDGLQLVIAQLATNPRSFPRVPEQRHFAQEVRHLVYRRTGSRVAYRVLFTIADAGQDGPTIYVFHVRHAAAKPLGRKQAREMIDED